MKTKLTLLAALALSLFAAPAKTQASIADDIAISELARELAIVACSYNDLGWFVHDYAPDAMLEGEYVDQEVYLEAGDEMVFRGLGDSDACDLDIGVYGPSGRLMISDTDYDATPVVAFIAPRSGTYTVRLSLEACHANGSYVAVLMAER